VVWAAGEVKWKPGCGPSIYTERPARLPPSAGSGDGRHSEKGGQAQALWHTPQAPSLLSDLPYSLLHEIFRCLDAKDLGGSHAAAASSTTCTRVARLAALHCDRWRPPPSLPRKGSFSRLRSAPSAQNSQGPTNFLPRADSASWPCRCARPRSPRPQQLLLGEVGRARRPCYSRRGPWSPLLGSQAGAELHSGSPEVVACSCTCTRRSAPPLLAAGEALQSFQKNQPAGEQEQKIK